MSKRMASGYSPREKLRHILDSSEVREIPFLKWADISLGIRIEFEVIAA